MKKSAPDVTPAPARKAEPIESAPAVEPIPAAPAPFVEPEAVAEPAQPEENMFSFLNAPLEEEPTDAIRPSNMLDLDDPGGGIDVTRFLVPELAEEKEEPEEGSESDH